MDTALMMALRYWVSGEQRRALRTYNRKYPGPDNTRGIYYFHQLTGVGYNAQG